jgi:hypothetical protein
MSAGSLEKCARFWLVGISPHNPSLYNKGTMEGPALQVLNWDCGFLLLPFRYAAAVFYNSNSRVQWGDFCFIPTDGYPFKYPAESGEQVLPTKV